MESNLTLYYQIQTFFIISIIRENVHNQSLFGNTVRYDDTLPTYRNSLLTLANVDFL